MKITKIKLSIFLILVTMLLLVIGFISYANGGRTASLSIKEATPKQLAEAMQSDDFFGEYTKTMLLVTGTVKAVTQQNADTIVQFEVTNSPSALGNVSCDVGNNQKVKVGDTVRILTVAYNAERQHTADVFMPKCYLIKQ